MKRSSGVLMPIFSLPSKYGIGTLGEEAYNFVDFLVETKQSYWQMLPIMQTSFGNSPYSAMSSFAGNPFFIDFDELKNDGLLKESDYKFLERDINPRRVDYQKQFDNKYKILKIACDNFKNIYQNELDTFCSNYDYFLNDYAIFSALKNKYNGGSFDVWDYDFKVKNIDAINKFIDGNQNEIEFYKIVQCLFYRQWFKLKKYANLKGIQIIGDTPIYSAYDSAEVWANPKYFYLDENRKPIEVSGCPPDGYSATGQLWGNPLYNYDYIKDNNYKYFIDKFSHLLELYDVLRIDHFRGFDSYYSIPYGSPDATIGKWVKGPGIELFNELKKSLSNVNIIVEDLGFLTDSVRNLLKETGFPGMKVMEFAFNAYDKGNTEYLPHTYPENCVAYLGTHDNDTFMGWIKSISPEDRNYAIEYLNLKEPSEYYIEALKVLYQSKSNLVIVQFQDILGTGGIGRMNTPSTISPMNWSYRLLPYELNDDTKTFLKQLTIESKRENIN
ncbi:MAG: 4-alpha-glucanotransferase [Lachnospiraceae bacterium]|nr:4-alpha-glucanotransferase [Lachnospiraceae bacterium]